MTREFSRRKSLTTSLGALAGKPASQYSSMRIIRGYGMSTVTCCGTSPRAWRRWCSTRVAM